MKLKTNTTCRLLWLAAWFNLIAVPMMAHAGATDLANAPMASANPVPPNIMFQLDNSGGVDVDVLLPTFNSLYLEGGVTGTNKNNLNGFFYLFPNAGVQRDEPQMRMGFPGGSNPDAIAWRAYFYGYNKIYYNPNTTYTPWPGNDDSGTPFGNAVPTSIRLNPYQSDQSGGNNTYDITSKVSFTARTFLNKLGTGCNDTGCDSYRSYTSTFLPASYYTWNDANANGVMDPGEGVLWQITSATTTYPSGRSYKAELQNFANWFQYYRTPFLALKGYMGQSLSIMSATNVGVIDLWHVNPNAPVSAMSSSSNVLSLQSAIYNIQTTPGDWTQPLHERAWNMWNYFNTPATSTNPPPPIQYACQLNYNILVSPGYLNDGGYNTLGSTGWSNDQTGGNPPAISTGNYDNAANASDSAWGNSPYSDDYSNTLADWTAYYYDQTLRTDLTAGQVPIPTQSHETNKNLHMTTYVLAPGALPQLSATYANTPLVNAQTADVWDQPVGSTKSGTATTVPWPIPWQSPCFVCENTVDDMWHAAINGRGIFVNSSDIYSGLQTIVNNILANAGAASSVAVVNPNITPTNNGSYSSSYVSGSWSGDLNLYPLTTTAASPSDPSGVSISKTPSWSAQAQLESLSPGNRYIGTYTGSAGVGFNWSSLTPAMQGELNSPITPPGPSDGATVLAFLRGYLPSATSPSYRTRSYLLGDIVNAAPVAVGAPSNGYSDTGYQDFFNSNSGRATVVYQGANDGMMHAFSGATGTELWAYVPGLLFNSRLAAYPATSTLVNLSMQQGFVHLYYVDGAAAAGDVDMANTGGTGGSGSWKTMLVGGLGKGGYGYYALDITSPNAGSDAAVGSKALWEFPNSATPTTTVPNIGFSYGLPLIVKTNAYGWVVLVTSGYNNGATTGGDGKGHLFVLNPSTGAVVADLSTGVGTAATPSGLAQISSFAYDANLDATVDYVYGGDLQGNVWRFDLSGAATSNWNVTKLATLVDSSGTAQPITSAPEVGMVHGHRMVYVGTGEYLGMTDVPGLPTSNASSSQTQTIYGLWDNQTATPLITPLRSNLIQQTLTVSGTTVSDTSAPPPNFSAGQEGWYADFPTSGERVYETPKLIQGTLAVPTNVPSDSNPCQPGGIGFEYFFNYQSGGAINNSTSTGLQVGNHLISDITIIGDPRDQLTGITHNSDGTTTFQQIPTNQSAAGVNRVQWREILTQ